MVGTLYLLVQTQAVVILFGFFVAWHWAALRRRDGRQRLERLGTARTVYCVGGQKPGLGTSRARGGEVGSDLKSKGERAELNGTGERNCTLVTPGRWITCLSWSLQRTTR